LRLFEHGSQHSRKEVVGPALTGDNDLGGAVRASYNAHGCILIGGSGFLTRGYDGRQHVGEEIAFPERAQVSRERQDEQKDYAFFHIIAPFLMLTEF
jgi:hypothetical protein